MVVEITSDTDLPTCLCTPSKQKIKARQLAHLHSSVPARQARTPQLQGFFSRTVIVILQNGEDIVIQFRPKPMDLEPFHLAWKVLGTAVPDIKTIPDQELERQGMDTYWMSCIPGRTWLEGLCRI